MKSIETLTSSNFLRVADKFFSEFILYDRAVGTTTRLLYAALFRYAEDGVCQLPQNMLGMFCGCCPRSIQTHLRALSALQYIRIEAGPNGRNVYRLLLSTRARFFIAQAASDLINVDGNDQGEEFSSDHAKNLRMGGENSSPIYKSDKSITPPLSPHVPASRATTPSARKPFPSTTPGPKPQAGGWGDSFFRKKRQSTASTFQTANALFERLYAAYPRKEAKESARAVWHQLWRGGALPALDRLLTALDHSCSSTAWNREHGRFVPYLVNWLRGRRWEDAPAPASPSGVQYMPEDGAHAPMRQTDARFMTFTPPKLTETPEEKAFREDHRQAVSELQKLWPAASRNSIQSGLLLARVRGIDLREAVSRARKYVQGANTARFSPGDWLKQEAFA